MSHHLWVGSSNLVKTERRFQPEKTLGIVPNELIVEFHLVVHSSKNIIFDYTEIQSNFNENESFQMTLYKHLSLTEAHISTCLYGIDYIYTTQMGPARIEKMTMTSFL